LDKQLRKIKNLSIIDYNYAKYMNNQGNIDKIVGKFTYGYGGSRQGSPARGGGLF